MTGLLDKSVRDLSNILSLGSANPDKTELEKALSLDVKVLDTVSKVDLLKYITVLGQYLITLKFAENLKKAAYMDIHKVFDHEINMKMISFDNDHSDMKKRTVKEKKSFLVKNSDMMKELENKLSTAEIEAELVSGMSRPVEEYIQVLKRVLDSNYGNNRGFNG